MVRCFASISELIALAESSRDYMPGCPLVADAWNNRESFEQALAYAKTGNDKFAEQAIAMLARLPIPTIDTRRACTVRSPYGGRVNVSDWLSGSPTPMRRRVKTDLDTNPLTVYVGVEAGASITAEQIALRGVTILAFLLRVQEVRPVNLVAFTDSDSRGEGSDRSGYTHSLIPIESRPLAVSQACYVLTSAGFTRQLTYRVDARINGFVGAWSEGFRAGSIEHVERLRVRFGASVDDLIILPVHNGDPLVDTPEAWLLDSLRSVGVISAD